MSEISPSKNMIYSAKAVSLADPRAGLGVVRGSLAVHMAGVARRKRQMVEELVGVHLAEFQASGAELIMGEARFTESKTVEARLNDGGVRRLRGDRGFLKASFGTSARPRPFLFRFSRDSNRICAKSR